MATLLHASTLHVKGDLGGCESAREAVHQVSRACFEQLLMCWFASSGLVSHQLQSFDRFLEQKLQEIVTENSQINVAGERGTPGSRITYKRVYIRSPAIREADGAYHRITPHECRCRGVSYNVSVHVNVLHETLDADGDVISCRFYSEALLCKIPCMVRSIGCSLRYGDIGECPLDPGGYFVVNGNEKSVVSQEKMRTNFIFVRKHSARHLTAEIRSLHATKTRSTSTLVVNLSARAGLRGEFLEVRLPFVDFVVPAGVVFRLIGFESLDEICDFVSMQCPTSSPAFSDMVRRSMDHVLLSESRATLVEHIGKEGTKEATNQRRVRYIEHILANELLPHQGLDASEEAQHRKATYLALVVVKLLRVYRGEEPPDDRDDYALKRVEPTGGLFALLFRQLFRQYLKMLNLQLTRAMESGKTLSLVDALNAKKITAGMKYAVSTGNWGIQKQSSQNGVAQVLTRTNYLASISHLRRVNTPINREGKLPKPRQLSGSHFGILCPVETPEGQACGLVENLALLVHTRLGTDGSYITQALVRAGLLLDLHRARGKLWRVIINGTIEGFAEDGFALVGILRRWRRQLILPPDTSLAADGDQWILVIDTDAGCLLRPLLVKDRLPLLHRIVNSVPPWQLWNQLFAHGVVELIDKIEERTVRIGSTHVDLHPSCMLGICAGMIPFLQHNQAPRNIYEAAMTKQSIGLFSYRSRIRMDTVAHTLHYPQVPLVQTSTQALSPCGVMPTGANVIVAVLSYTGFNQEDSIIFNRDALNRGLFRSTICKSFKDEEKGIGSDIERFGLVPRSAVGSRKADYSKVEDDGLPLIGQTMHSGDVIIGKKMQTTQLGTDKKKRTIMVDHSTILMAAEPMNVARVLLTTNKDGARLVRVKLHASRIPEIGDKFSSHHGQKGVIGIILPQVDMPYTADGICPDIIINPHALPGRMTVGQLLESLLGKLCCMQGEIGNGTPFSGLRPDMIGEELRRHGFQTRGDEVLFNGWTGEPLATEVCIGAVHYQRLRHCVVDKVHARSRGPVQLITRQPVEGRSRGGGLRVGEMERDCMLAHGASAVILDRLFKQSDEFEAFVCRQCGLFGEHIADDVSVCVQSRLFCRGCRLEGPENLAKVHLPYSMKLLAQEVGGMNIAMRFKIEEKGQERMGL